MSTKTSEGSYGHTTRAVEVSMTMPNPASVPSEAVDRTVHVADVCATSVNGGPFSAPTLFFRPGEEGAVVLYTRGQWEALKREIDQAWNAFEAEWPLDGQPRAIRPGARVELAHLEAPLPAKIIGRPFRAGERGTVVRLVHLTVEGKPIEDQRAPTTLAHVLFDGRADPDVVAFSPECLRAVPDLVRGEFIIENCTVHNDPGFKLP